MRFRVGRALLLLILLALPMAAQARVKESPHDTAPVRKPSLSFETLIEANELLRLSPSPPPESMPKLRAVNVTEARLTLYRISKPDALAAAVEPMRQINLAPTESVYFASHNGQEVWQGDAVFSLNPNAEQSIDVPLPRGDKLASGLYFLSAQPKDAKLKIVAGLWFRVANLALTALSQADSIQVFATDMGTMRPAKDMTIQSRASDGRLIAETKSDAEGKASLARADVSLVIGIAPAGDVAFLDKTTFRDVAPLPPEAEMATDRAIYGPDDRATVTLSLRDPQGRFQKIPDSALKLLRPDKSLYGEQPVPTDKSGPQLLSVRLPVTPMAGEWSLLWQQADGTVLAQTPLRLATDRHWPTLEATPDRSVLDADGALAFTVKTNRAWQTGSIQAALASPTFAAWPRHRFAVPPPAEYDALPIARFITNADNEARVSLALPLREEAIKSGAIAFTVRLDRFAAPTTLTIPIKPPYAWVGIRPLPDDHPFTENSEARFDVIAVDANGKRRPWSDLSYHVYEEGRRFEWYPSEGRWDYRPLPEHRRIGGGRFSLSATSETTLRWPVTAGHYLLEITDSNGAVLARQAFDAGWNPPRSVPPADDRLSLSASADAFESNRPNAITLRLAEPATVALWIGDGRPRLVEHRFMPAGDNSVMVSPGNDWGMRARVYAQALFANGETAFASLARSLRHADRELIVAVHAPARATTGAAFALPVSVQNVAKQQPTFINVQALPLSDGEGGEGEAINVASLKIEKDGKAQAKFDLPPFTGALRLTVTAWNDEQSGAKTVAIPAQPVLAMKGDLPPRLFLNDRATLGLTLTNNANDGAVKVNMTLPIFLKTKGNPKENIALKRGQSRALTFDLAASGEGRDALRLDVAGPNNFHATREWPMEVLEADSAPTEAVLQRLEPRQSLDLPAGSSVSLSPLPFGDPRLALPDNEPMTTVEVANALTTMKERELSKDHLVTLRHRLEARQNADGGFPVAFAGGVSDIAATSAALIALHEDSPPTARPASLWLQRKLENAWFDESEGSDRALAFFALSEAGKADVSALRYFADMSRGKNMSAIAKAALGLALAKNNDEKSAQAWIEEGQKGLETGALPFPSLLDSLARRAGSWAVEVNGAERKKTGVDRLAVAGKTTLRNVSDRTLYVYFFERKDSSSKEKSVREKPLRLFDRKLYALDGSEVSADGALTKGQTYILLTQISGGAKKEKNSPASSFIRIPLGAGLSAVAAPEGSAGLKTLWPWLPSPLAILEGSEAMADGVNFMLGMTENGFIVTLVKADYRGEFVLPSVVARDESGNRIPSESNALRIRVR